MRREPQGTGDCFEASARLMLAGINRPLTLVHGRPMGTGDANYGKRFWHAWVEEVEETTIPAHVLGVTPAGPFTLTTITVLDYSQGRRIELPADTYYKIGRIRPEDCQRYSVEETQRMLSTWGHWGPWVDDYPPVHGAP